MLDIIIKNATVIDGSGADGYSADIGIKDGKIETIGNVGSITDSAKEVIDANGLTVTPGFIDSHSHSDNALVDFPELIEKCEQGITTAVGGQCGSSCVPKPMSEHPELRSSTVFFEDMKSRRFGSNTALFLGHGTVRSAVMGMADRAPTEEELEKMRTLVKEGVRAGAMGISFGLIYTPGCYAKTDELIEIAKAAAEESKDKAALIIKPSNEGLYSFYEKLGFKTTFYYDEYEYFGKKSSDKKLDFITFKEYSTKREQLLKNTPHVCWENMMEYIGLGGEFFKGEDFCGLVEKTNNKLFLREFIGNEEGIDALLLNLDYKSAVIRVTENKTPFGMLRPLKSENFPEKMYMGFAMD